MNKREYKKFCKRYDKFINNNLPTPFWDDERQVQEYVYFYNGKSFFNMEIAKDELNVYSNLSDALGDIAFTSFYYPFTDSHIKCWKDEKGKIIREVVTEHSHSHSFEGVVESLYYSPETFNISKDEESYYSKQELEYLRRVQKYLLFIGMKDITLKKDSKRYSNAKHSKYENVLIYEFSDFTLNKIINGERDFRVIKWFPEYTNRIYKPKEYQALVVDKDDNFKMFIEFTNEEVKLYKDIKKLCDNNFNDNDKVILIHFKILEVFS